MNIKRILAIAKRCVIVKLRFKWEYLMTSLIGPTKTAFAFLILYWGFFTAGAHSIGYINSGNYLVFLFLGMLFMSIFDVAWQNIPKKFLEEKYWQSIQGLLVSPATKLEMILGYGIEGVIEVLPIFFISLTVSYILMPINPFKFLFIILLLVLIYLMILGFSFIQAAFILSNEDIASLFTPLNWMLLLLSCFYYPIESLPKFTHFMIKLNPIYYTTNFIRELWLYNNFRPLEFFYFLTLCLVSLMLGAYIFNKVWKKTGIQGY